MNIKDSDDFKSPNHKPWLIVIIAVVAALIFLWREKVHKQDVEARIAVTSENFNSDPTVLQSHIESEAQPTNAPVTRTVDATDMQSNLLKARGHEAKRRFVDARKIYLELLATSLDDATRQSVESAIGKINMDLIMTPYAMPEKVEYVVKGGDSLDKIAKKTGTTVDLLAKSNNIKNPSRIKVGDVLRVFAGKLSIKISKSDIDLIVYMNGEFFKKYSVGTGKFGKTPVGTFIVTEKQKEPVWWHPSGKSYQFGEKENILGTRWMSLKAVGDTAKVKGYGIHGTWLPDSIGKAESAGCVRMRNADVEELYTYLPDGTTVEIVE